MARGAAGLLDLEDQVGAPMLRMTIGTARFEGLELAMLQVRMTLEAGLIGNGLPALGMALGAFCGEHLVSGGDRTRRVHPLIFS